MATSTEHSGNRSQANGVLPVTASQTSGNGLRPVATAKPPTPKLKVIIRRLAPGLTEVEFNTILGNAWKLGQGRVDWFLYKPGKDSKDPSKPSRPSRAYLHLTSEIYLMSLSTTVQQSLFEDAQNTFNSSCLVGPPSVEYAPYGRTPGGRRRIDARAGTIDQDSEFMAFLEGLANPITTREIDAESSPGGTPTKHEKVTTTPLVQYLKDKKASKNKDAAVKAAKKQEAQLAKGKATRNASVSPDDPKKKVKDAKSDKLVEKAAKEAVRILNREASSKSSATEPVGIENTPPPKLDLSKVPTRQRNAVTKDHIRMLQRDLGLSPAQAHRQVRRDTSDAQRAIVAAEKAAGEAKESPSSQTTPSIPTAPKVNWLTPGSKRSRGKLSPEDREANKTMASAGSAAGPATAVVLLKKPAEIPQASTPVPQQIRPAPNAIARKPPPVAVPSDGATQAFVKHANPSQGVTEPLLKEAMEKYGAVSMVEIDKRKGFAYVNFVDTGGLQKAMAANPISVAQGTVQVMQRKGTALPPENKPARQAPHAPVRGGRGGRGGTIGRRGGRGIGRSGGQGGSSEGGKVPSAPTGSTAN